MARTYEESLRLEIIPRIGSIAIHVITRGDVQRLIDEIAAERTPRHAQKSMTALRVVLHHCARYGELEQTPCIRIRIPVGEGQRERPARILTPEECERLLVAADADDADFERSFAGPLVALANTSGARLGELLALPWGPAGLDLKAGVVRVRRSLDRVRGDDGRYSIVSTKTRHARRASRSPVRTLLGFAVTGLRRVDLLTARSSSRTSSVSRSVRASRALPGSGW